MRRLKMQMSDELSPARKGETSWSLKRQKKRRCEINFDVTGTIWIRYDLLLCRGSKYMYFLIGAKSDFEYCFNI